MIVFDLRCGRDHVFEAWFGSGADFDAQAARGLVVCPICGDGEVVKAAMAPAVPSKGNTGTELGPAGIKALLGKLAKAQREVLKGSDYVGDGFAAEARAIHLGEAEARSIHGQATRRDADALREEGVPLSPLPLPVVAATDEN